jgi:hypothetical protein
MLTGLIPVDPTFWGITEPSTCSECGGEVRIIASVEDPAVIQKILAHLDNMTGSAAIALLPDCRASPSRPVGLFD